MNRHDETLAVIDTFVAEHGYPPSRRDVASALGCSVSTAHQRIKSLARRGDIELTPGVARSIKGVVMKEATVEL